MFDSGNPFGARKLLEQTLATSKKTLGANHPRTRDTARALNHVLAKFGGHPRRGKQKARKKRKK
jgi:hypothetical protein